MATLTYMERLYKGKLAIIEPILIDGMFKVFIVNERLGPKAERAHSNYLNSINFHFIKNELTKLTQLKTLGQ